ncbi:hypothetical protein RQM65_12495 [Pricia sp. S334]|uniref:DUF4149 domain-containing protein n=1 Tax=Pricia mediterranea TaxID=3076079 RepID=A0ABU3L7E1_9FLAO|nr:hypothetical protein [Pricia sp. S334]MDT7829488.1 hypothetical protein [Pricia sp. S334]
MTTSVKLPLASASVFLWLGFVGAISFLEAWLKFLAPGITIPLGLGIGRLVFNALNAVEWVLAVVILTDMIRAGRRLFSSKNGLYFVPFVVLAVQTFWLLPQLDARAEILIQGYELEASNLHFYYVGMEIVKVVCLLIFGIKLFKT